MVQCTRWTMSTVHCPLDMSLEKILVAGAYLVLGNNQARRIMSGREDGDDHIKIKYTVTRK